MFTGNSGFQVPLLNTSATLLNLFFQNIFFLGSTDDRVFIRPVQDVNCTWRKACHCVIVKWILGQPIIYRELLPAFVTFHYKLKIALTRNNLWLSLILVNLSIQLHSHLVNSLNPGVASQLDKKWEARVAKKLEHSPPTNVARVQILASTPYVGRSLLLILSFAP